MATYGLIPGAGSDAWYWHRVAPLLEARGHTVVAVDLPCTDDAAGLPEYTTAVVDAVSSVRAAGGGTRSDDGGAEPDDLILVAQSMAGFTAPLVCDRLPVALILLVAAMVPRAGESPGEWWSNTGQAEAERAMAEREGRDPDDGDPVTIFLHDVPDDVARESEHHVSEQSGTPFVAPWPGASWPDVPTRALVGRRDRLFPPEFLRGVVRDRLGIEADEIDSGHLPALARPDELVEWLEGCRVDAGIA